MSATAGNSISPNSNIDIIPFDSDGRCENVDLDHDLNQIRSLFIDGMRVNNAPDDYIQKSLQSDLNDANSMKETYFSGDGTFLMLVEDEEFDQEQLDISNSISRNISNIDSSRRRRRSVKGIVGLSDLSSSENGVDSNGTSSEKEHGKKLCELRRMSIHSSCRRSGYGAKLIEACLCHAKKKQFDGIKLYTGGWMDAAIDFYIKMGFEDKGRLDYNNSDGSTVTIAHLELMF